MLNTNTANPLTVAVALWLVFAVRVPQSPVVVACKFHFCNSQQL